MLLVAGFVLAFSDTAESCFESFISVEVFFVGQLFLKQLPFFLGGGYMFCRMLIDLSAGLILSAHFDQIT